MTWRYYETPHHDTLTCRSGDVEVTITLLSRIARLAGRTRDLRSTPVGTIAR